MGTKEGKTSSQLFSRLLRRPTNPNKTAGYTGFSLVRVNYRQLRIFHASFKVKAASPFFASIWLRTGEARTTTNKGSPHVPLYHFLLSWKNFNTETPKEQGLDSL